MRPLAGPPGTQDTHILSKGCIPSSNPAHFPNMFQYFQPHLLPGLASKEHPKFNKVSDSTLTLGNNVLNFCTHPLAPTAEPAKKNEFPGELRHGNKYNNPQHAPSAKRIASAPMAMSGAPPMDSFELKV